jgi:hypothetical protein
MSLIIQVPAVNTLEDDCNMQNNRVGWPRVCTLDTYYRGARFKSRPGQRLF